MLTQRLRSAASEEHGVGIVELLVAIVLMTVVGSAVVTTLVRGMTVTAVTQSRFDAVAHLQKSVDRMTGPLRGAAPVNLSLSDATTAVVEVWDANLVGKFRYTYTYCPTQQRVHMRREPVATAYAVINCASTTAPVLIDRVSNGTAVPVFRYRMSDGVTPATTAAQVFQIDVAVQRALANQPNPIRVDTQVRLRNAR